MRAASLCLLGSLAACGGSNASSSSEPGAPPAPRQACVSSPPPGAISLPPGVSLSDYAEAHASARIKGPAMLVAPRMTAEVKARLRAKGGSCTPTLQCRIDAGGCATGCTVFTGCGDAAVDTWLLAELPFLSFRPATIDDKPIDAAVKIPFKLDASAE